MSGPDVLIPVGKIIGTHGIKGLLKVHSFSGNFESLQFCSTVTLKSATGALSHYGLNSVVPHAGKLMIGLTGLNDINLAQPLVGSEVCLMRSQLPVPEESEYYWCDLIGLQVATVDGR